jgi:ribose-phosphate pyrophosphokinase
MTTALRSEQLVLLTGSANPTLAASVARAFGISIGSCLNHQFPDGERHLELHDTVRDCDVFLLQPTAPPVAEHLVELLLLADACRRAGAGRLTAVMPYFGYARHDRRATGREPVAARLVADLLVTAGIERVVAVDLHTPATEAFFSVPVEHVSAVDLLAKGLGVVPDNAVIVAPDLGAARLAERFASLLARPLATILKTRLGGEAVHVRQLVGDVRGRTPIIVDDMISTGHTVAAAVRALLAAECAPDLTVVVTHGLFVGAIDQVIGSLPIARLVTTDTVRQRVDELPLPVKVVSVAPLLVDVIGRLHRSVSLNEILVHQ